MEEWWGGGGGVGGGGGGVWCFFFNDTATTEIYTLSLHDALPIFFAVKRIDDALSLLSRFNKAAVPEAC